MVATFRDVDSQPPVRQALCALVLFIAAATPLTAQHVLFADYDGKFLPVLRARQNAPIVKVNDKLVLATGRRFSLNKVKEYLPVFVAVRKVEVKTTYVDAIGKAINNNFHFRASLETPYDLEDVFIVLELNMESAGKVLFLQEVGRLKSRDPKVVAVRIPTSGALGSGRYRFHLFAQGIEVLQSQIPALERDQAVDRMIAARLLPGPEADPQVFIGPEPEYPEALLKAKVAGRAVISVRIGANGGVFDPMLKSATEPAFGEAALQAVRLWRFLPRMKNGHPVETEASVPFDFTPPAMRSAKS